MPDVIPNPTIVPITSAIANQLKSTMATTRVQLMTPSSATIADAGWTRMGYFWRRSISIQERAEAVFPSLSTSGRALAASGWAATVCSEP